MPKPAEGCDQPQSETILFAVSQPAQRGSQIGPVGLQARQPRARLPSRNGGSARLRQCDEVVSMPPAHLVQLPVLRELLHAELPHGLEHPEPPLSIRVLDDLHQAGGDQGLQARQHVDGVAATAHHLGGFKRPATGENGEAPKERLLWLP